VGLPVWRLLKELPASELRGWYAHLSLEAEERQAAYERAAKGG
jgi:hypothetical protein